MGHASLCCMGMEPEANPRGWFSFKEREREILILFQVGGFRMAGSVFFQGDDFFYMFYICLHDYFHSNMMFLFGSSKDKCLELLL